MPRDLVSRNSSLRACPQKETMKVNIFPGIYLIFLYCLNISYRQVAQVNASWWFLHLPLSIEQNDWEKGMPGYIPFTETVSRLPEQVAMFFDA